MSVIPPEDGLVASIHLARGTFRLDVGLEVPAGRTTALVGPNGAGKTTTLQVLAGLLPPDRSELALGGRILDSFERGIHLPAARRGIGVVFQDYLLFPHLSAVENVAFGLRARRVPRRSALDRAHERLAGLGLEQVAEARPYELSGGQAQRVALARALVLEPAMLLLDEPLAALDTATRIGVRTELAAELARFGGVTVVVTHDPIDAMLLADEVVVLDRGAVVQRGTPAGIAADPSTPYVAQLVGRNLLHEASGDAVVFAPHDVRLTEAEPAPRAGWSAVRCRVRGLEDRGEFARVHLVSHGEDRGEAFSADASAATIAALVLRGDHLLWAQYPQRSRSAG